jgi:hypothetical protein
VEKRKKKSQTKGLPKKKNEAYGEEERKKLKKKREMIRWSSGEGGLVKKKRGKDKKALGLKSEIKKGGIDQNAPSPSQGPIQAQLPSPIRIGPQNIQSPL